VIANGNPRRLAGKCHRKQTATLAVVRVKRCGKSAPAFRVTGVARQTPPEARSRRPHHGAVAQVLEGCSPEPAGRPLEAPGNGVPRWMVAAALPGNAEQNPAYRPTRPPRHFDQRVQRLVGWPVRSRYAVDPSTDSIASRVGRRCPATGGCRCPGSRPRWHCLAAPGRFSGSRRGGSAKRRSSGAAGGSQCRAAAWPP
jgi:hypothetical protein